MTAKNPMNGSPPARLGREKVLFPDVLHPITGETLADTLIAKIYEGVPLHRAIEYVGICAETLGEWRNAYPDLAGRLNVAREAFHDTKADTLLTAHDDIPDPAKARIYSDNVKWLLSKRDKRYSDRIEVNVEARVSLADALKEASGRVLSACYQEIAEPVEARAVIDSGDAWPTDSQSDTRPQDDPGELDSLLS